MNTHALAVNFATVNIPVLAHVYLLFALILSAQMNTHALAVNFATVNIPVLAHVHLLFALILSAAPTRTALGFWILHI
jgi:hypothetical protein